MKGLNADMTLIRLMTPRRVTASMLIAFFLTMFGFIAVITFVPTTVMAITLYVGGVGPGNYTTIQEAIDAAGSGDTVYVYSGTYHEYLNVGKTLTLIGENRSTTTIQTTAAGSPAVAVFAPWVNISGFTIDGDTFSNGILLVPGNNATVSGNIVTDSTSGIGCYQGNDTKISDNLLLSSSSDGIFIYACRRLTVLNNTMMGNGIGLNGEKLEEWNSHTIGTSNTVNGKPVYYWKDVVGGTVPNGAGEVILANASGVTVDGQYLINGGSGILIGFSSGNNVSNNQLISNTGTAMYIYQSGRNTIANNIVSGCYWGVYFDHSSGNVIVNNTVSGSYFGIYLYYSHDSDISRNDVRFNSLQTQIAGITLYRSNRNILDRNTVLSNYYNGIHLDLSIRNRITNNSVLSNQHVGIDVRDYSDFTLIMNNSAFPAGVSIFQSSNVTASDNRADGIDAQNSDDDVISNNTANVTANGWRNTVAGNVGRISMGGFYGLVSNNTGSIYASGSRHEIRNNNVSNCYSGIDLSWSADNITITGNIGVNNLEGIRAWMVPDLLIANNTFISSNYTGILLNATENSRVVNNTITDSGTGIIVRWLSTNVTVAGNLLQYNRKGLSLEVYSYGNRVYHNDFLYNTLQAADNDTNFWDDGYPSGGNFWSDYAGVDLKSGSSQDLPGSDGIGDNPQVIPFSSDMDRYPLMQPSGAGPWPPAPPRNLQATAGDGQVTLTWSPPSFDGASQITNYSVYRSTTSGAETLLIRIGNVTSYADLGLTNGLTYYYQVTARNAIGEGARSNEASAMPVGGPTVPGPPSNLAATGGVGKVTLAWSPPMSNGGSPITNYEIYRGTTSNGETYLAEIGNVYSYVDSGLGGGQRYFYRVSAKNAVGEGAQSNEANATTLAAPGAPTGLSAVAGNGQVALSWFPPASNGGSPITNYEIYRGSTSGGETFLAEIGNVLSFTNSGLVNGQTYYYRVSAKNAVGEGPMSNEANAIPASVPAPPTGLLAAAGDGQVTLTWSPPTNTGGSPITNYMVYRGASTGGEAFLVQLGNVLSHVDSGLTNGQIYFYKVSAVNAIGEGQLSGEASATPTLGINPPSEPLNLQAAPGDRQVTLTWSAPASDGGSPITNYILYRGTVAGSEAFLAQIGDTLTYTDAGLTNGQTYFYTVSARNAAGEGLMSNEASATATAVPPANLPPTCNIISPIPGSTVAGTERIAGIASDVDGTVQRVEVKIDDEMWIEASGNTSWIYDWDTTAVPNGQHTIHARSFDGTNYSAEVSIAVTVNNAPSPPPQETSVYQIAFWAILAVAIVETILLLFLFLKGRKDKGAEEERLHENGDEESVERDVDSDSVQGREPPT